MEKEAIIKEVQDALCIIPKIAVAAEEDKKALGKLSESLIKVLTLVDNKFNIDSNFEARLVSEVYQNAICVGPVAPNKNLSKAVSVLSESLSELAMAYSIMRDSAAPMGGRDSHRKVAGPIGTLSTMFGLVEDIPDESMDEQKELPMTRDEIDSLYEGSEED